MGPTKTCPNCKENSVSSLGISDGEENFECEFCEESWSEKVIDNNPDNVVQDNIGYIPSVQEEEEKARTSRDLNNKDAQQKIQRHNDAATAKDGLGLRSAKIDSNKKIGRKSWAPAALTDIAGKDDNYVYRGFNSNIPGRIQKAKAEGWDFNLKSEDLPFESMSEGGLKDGQVQRRELLYGRMPKELAEERRRYFESRETNSKTAQESFSGSVGSGNAYGKIETTSQ